MSVVNGYCTEVEIREHFADAGEVMSAAVIERAIEAASRHIDRLCGRHFYQEAATSVRQYRVEDAYVAWVDDISTTTGLVIKTDTTGDFTWATTWTADTDYILEPLNANVVGSGTTAQPYAWWRIIAVGTSYTLPIHSLRPTLQVTARFGWSAVPDDVQEACILLASALIHRRSSPAGVAGFSEFGPMRISRSDPDVERLLYPYFKMRVGAV